MTTTMRAVVCTRAGGPDVLEVHEVPVPAVRDGWSLVRIGGAGLNRSELRTRAGHSPDVTFPRVLGIECVGTVAASATLAEGTTVAAVMGEMGRAFDGGYAEWALLPDALLMPVATTLPWDVLAALPETSLTAQGALDTLGLTRGDRLLIRGGTSSVGLAAAAIAAELGVETAATSRRADRLDVLLAAGNAHAVVDDAGSGAETVRSFWPDGPDGVLDLVGARTALDSLRLVRRGGVVCVAGSLSGWALERFEPVAAIPPGTRLTAFHSGSLAGSTATLQRVVDAVEAGTYRPRVERVVGLDGVADAHREMEADAVAGKVVLVP